MKLTKDELIEQINSLPEFELEDMYLQRSNPEKVTHFVGVVEKNTTNVVACVGRKYSLVQFKDIFLPAISPMNQLEGAISYWRGKAILGLFPLGEEFRIGQDSSLGLVLKNSVDGSGSVFINFCFLQGKERLYLGSLPIKGVKKSHLGDPLAFANDFLAVLHKTKEAWRQIADKFDNYKMDQQMTENLLKRLKLSKSIARKILGENQRTLWDLFVTIIGEMEQKKFKSQFHRLKRVERIASEMYSFAGVLAI